LLVVGPVDAAGDALVGGVLNGVLLQHFYDGSDVRFSTVLANVVIVVVVIIVTRGRLTSTREFSKSCVPSLLSDRNWF
jgi:hypothetical protein